MAKKKNATRADGRIAVQVYIGKDLETGKRHYKTVYGATQKEADEKALDVKLSMRRGVDVLAERDTFGDWSDRWLRIKETEVSFGMMTAYRSCVKHLSPLKHTPIAKIRAADLQEIVASLYCQNPNTGKAASKKTLTCIKITASQIFQFAIDNRVLDYNPAAAVRIPADAATQTKRALTREEQRWINDTPHRAQLPAMIMLYSGLRRGELLALTWGDINLGEKTISVNKAVEMINGKPEVKTMTKTASGMRIVYIPSVLVSFLAQQPKTSLLVCPATSGRYMSSSSWSKLWNSYLRDLNVKYGNFGNCTGEKKRSKYDPQGVPMMIPRFTAHWLRHTFATMLYFSGVDILTAKEQLGHSDVKTTMGIYTHLDAQYKQRSMSKLDEYLDDASHMQVSG